MADEADQDARAVDPAARCYVAEVGPAEARRFASLLRFIRDGVPVRSSDSEWVHATAGTVSEMIDVAVAAAPTRGFRKVPRDSGVDVEAEFIAIQRVVSDKLGIMPADIRGPSRSARASRARRIMMYLVDRRIGLSSVEIGKRFGKRDHSTVLSAIRRVERDPSEVHLADEIEEKLDEEAR